MFLVLGTHDGKPVTATLTLNGEPLTTAAGKDAPQSKLVVNQHTLYELVNQGAPRNGLLEITADAPGLEAYAFTHCVTDMKEHGEKYKRVQIAEGHHFLELPENLTIEYKRATAYAMASLQLIQKLAGMPTDRDRHGGNIKIKPLNIGSSLPESTINHYDFGMTDLQLPTDEQKRALGKILAQATKDTARGGDFTAHLLKRIDNTKGTPEVRSYLAGFKREMLALGDYFNESDAGSTHHKKSQPSSKPQSEFTAILGNALYGEHTDPVIREAFTKEVGTFAGAVKAHFEKAMAISSVQVNNVPLRANLKMPQLTPAELSIVEGNSPLQEVDKTSPENRSAPEISGSTSKGTRLTKTGSGKSFIGVQLHNESKPKNTHASNLHPTSTNTVKTNQSSDTPPVAYKDKEIAGVTSGEGKSETAQTSATETGAKLPVSGSGQPHTDGRTDVNSTGYNATKPPVVDVNLHGDFSNFHADPHGTGVGSLGFIMSATAFKVIDDKLKQGKAVSTIEFAGACIGMVDGGAGVFNAGGADLFSKAAKLNSGGTAVAGGVFSMFLGAFAIYAAHESKEAQAIGGSWASTTTGAALGTAGNLLRVGGSTAFAVVSAAAIAAGEVGGHLYVKFTSDDATKVAASDKALIAMWENNWAGHEVKKDEWEVARRVGGAFGALNHKLGAGFQYMVPTTLGSLSLVASMGEQKVKEWSEDSYILRAMGAPVLQGTLEAAGKGLKVLENLTDEHGKKWKEFGKGLMRTASAGDFPDYVSSVAAPVTKVVTKAMAGVEKTVDDAVKQTKITVKVAAVVVNDAVEDFAKKAVGAKETCTKFCADAGQKMVDFGKSVTSVTNSITTKVSSFFNFGDDVDAKLKDAVLALNETKLGQTLATHIGNNKGELTLEEVQAHFKSHNISLGAVVD